MDSVVASEAIDPGSTPGACTIEKGKKNEVADTLRTIAERGLLHNCLNAKHAMGVQPQAMKAER